MNRDRIAARIGATVDGARHHVWAHAARAPGLWICWTLLLILFLAVALLAGATSQPYKCTGWLP
jgi:hypothetical protein